MLFTYNKAHPFGVWFRDFQQAVWLCNQAHDQGGRTLSPSLLPTPRWGGPLPVPPDPGPQGNPLPWRFALFKTSCKRHREQSSGLSQLLWLRTMPWSPQVAVSSRSPLLPTAEGTCPLPSLLGIRGGHKGTGQGIPLCLIRETSVSAELLPSPGSSEDLTPGSTVAKWASELNQPPSPARAESLKPC